MAVCLVGLSPAVVTETLYALAVARRPRILPYQLHLVTTRTGLTTVAGTLLGGGGALDRLRQEYRLPIGAFQCPSGNVHVLANARGDPLDDIVTSRDSEAVGEQISRLVQHLASDPRITLHCSLAGGRKTMGALLATALQLHGRPGDRLYHVLVSPPYDQAPDFFFPTSRSCPLASAGGTLDARRARVWLAEVPIVRLGGVVRELGLSGTSLVRLAAEIEEDAAGRLRLEPLRLDAARRTVEVGVRRTSLAPQLLALYLLYADLRRQCREPRCARGARCAECQPTDDEVHDRRERLLAIYRGVGGRADEEAARGPSSERLDDFRAWLQQARSRLNARIRAALGAGPRAERYAITEVPPTPGAPRRRGLALRPGLIRASGRQG
jgi:CRISPR-associated protein (TIGR02584 family)